MSAPAKAKGGLLVVVALCACAAAAFWISNGVAPWSGDTHNVWHHYEYLTEGFVHGHTSLSLEPPEELLRLKDPYDPVANAPYRLWDASLYNGKFYLYFGPTPVAVMLPWRILTGHELPQRLAAAAWAVIGLAGLACLLWEVRRRHFPRLSGVALALILVTAFHASWLPVTLRRSGVWDLPIVAATACAWWTLYLLWKFHDSGGRLRWGAATGVALALLMGSRVTFVPGAAAIALLLLVPAGGAGAARSRRWRAACAGAALAAAGGIALLAYNRARFGSWTEFGMRYVLFGEDYRGVRYSSPSFIPFNFWTYIFSAPRLGPYFPFVHPFWSDSLPAGFVGFEEVYGILRMLPVHLLGLAALAWAHHHRRDASTGPLRVTLAGALLLSAFSAIILFSWAWACSRFENEFLAGWTVVTALGLMVVFGSEGPSRPGRLVRAVAAAAACWSIAATWLASAEFRGFMAQTNPRAYAAVAHALDYPSLWAARSKGISFGPVDLVLRIPPSKDRSPCVLMASGRPQRVNQLALYRADQDHVRLVLLENEHRVLATPLLETKDGMLRVRVAAPWLYPPAASPYWDGMDPVAREDRQTLFSIQSDSDTSYVHSGHSDDPLDFLPAVQRRNEAAPDMPTVESIAPAGPAR